MATEGLSVVRVDMIAWYLNITASSIMKKTERVTAVVATKSVVDVNKVDFPTFLNLYQNQLKQAGLGKEQVKQAIVDLQDIRKAFHEEAPVPQLKSSRPNDTTAGRGLSAVLLTPATMLSPTDLPAALNAAHQK